MQGYLFSKPLPAQELAGLLRSASLMVSPPLQPAANAAPEESTVRSRLRSASV